MPVEKNDFEEEVVVINVGSRADNIVLDLRFTKPRSKQQDKLRPENIIQPISGSEMERAGRAVAKGYMSEIQKQMQQQVQTLTRIMPITPSDIIQITLSKQDYVKMGKPTVDDKLTLKLRMKAVP